MACPDERRLSGWSWLLRSLGHPRRIPLREQKARFTCCLMRQISSQKVHVACRIRWPGQSTRTLAS